MLSSPTRRCVVQVTAFVLAVAVGSCSAPHGQPDNQQALTDIEMHHAGAEEIVSGTVVRVLPPSHGPSGVHERFIVDLGSTSSHFPLYVTDNISIAQTAPIRPGDAVTVKGELAFNDRGPLLHWTHRDPRLRHAPGYIEVGGRFYE